MKVKKQTIRAIKRPPKVSTKPMPANSPDMPGYKKGGMVGKGKC